MSAQVVLRSVCAGRVGLPMGGRQKARIRAFLTAVVAALALQSLLFVAPALCQRSDAFLGVSQQSPPAPSEIEGRVRLQPPRDVREQEAGWLLRRAQEDLVAGSVSTAREQLRWLGRTFSGTVAADEADRTLARIDGVTQPSRPLPTASGREIAGRGSGHGFSAASGGRVGLESGSPQGALQRLRLARSFHAATPDRIFFAEGSIELGTRERDLIAAQARWLTANPEAIVTLEAHADDAGSPARNAGLARQRGEAVRQRMLEVGIASERVRVVVRGREQPIALCPEPDCTAQNRRVVTTVTDATNAAIRNAERTPPPRHDADTTAPNRR